MGAEFTRRVTLSDLEMATTPVAQQRKTAETVTVAVTRASVRQEYNVPVEGTNLQAAAVGQ
ncbi:hypothetical protein D3C83_283200 [compost metagenome]